MHPIVAGCRVCSGPASRGEVWRSAEATACSRLCAATPAPPPPFAGALFPLCSHTLPSRTHDHSRGAVQLVNHHLYTVPLVKDVPDEHAVFGPMVSIAAVGRAPSMAVTFIRFRRNIDPGSLAGGAVHAFSNTTLWCGLSWESAAPTALAASLQAITNGPAFDSENPEDIACLPSGPLAILTAAEVQLEVTQCRSARASQPVAGGAALPPPASPQPLSGSQEAAADPTDGPDDDGGADSNLIIPVTVSVALGAFPRRSELRAAPRCRCDSAGVGRNKRVA